MSNDNNELKYTTKLDVNPAIKAAKDLAKEIREATKIKSDDPLLKKSVEYLSRQNSEIRKINQGLATEKTYQKEIASYNQKIVDLEDKRAKLADLVNGRKYAQKAVEEYKGKAIGLYSDRTDKPAMENQAKLAEAEKRLANIDLEIAKTNREITVLESGLEASVNRINSMESASAEFVQEFSGVGEVAREMSAYSEGTSQDIYQMVGYIRQQRDAQREVERATRQSQQATEEYETAAEQVSRSTSNIAEEAKNGYEEIVQAAKDAANKTEIVAEEISNTPIDINADLSSMSMLELINFIQQLKTEMKSLETQAKTSAPTEEQNQRYEDLAVTLERAKGQMSTLKKEYKDMANNAEEGENANKNFADSFKSFSDAFVSISQANGLVGKLKTGIATLGTTSLFAGAEAQQALTMATAGLNLVVEVVTRLLTIIQTVFNALKTLASAIINAFNKIFDTIKKVGEAIKDNIIKLANKAKSSFGNMFSFSGSDMKRTLQMLTKYIFGVRSFFFLYRKLRKAVGEGIENLVQFESETNKTNEAITEIKTSLLYLKNAWAAAFAPIINVVYPILVKFLNLLASIGNAIARFVAALTGQSTVLQALRVNVGDYADSLKDAAGGAGSAAKAQEELNDRLAAFDDLNVLGVDDDPNRGSGGGGGGGSPEDLLNPNDMFERINTPMNRLADLIRKAWETGDAFQLGAFFADRLNESLDKAHAWLTGKGREKILTIANFIGTLIDGVLSNNDLPIKIGQVLADIFDVALTFVNTVITSDRMYMIGLRIAQALNTAIPQIVPKIGETLGNLFKSAIKGMWGFISNADLAEWGKSFGDAINNFMTQMSGQAGKGGKDTLSGWQLLGMSITELADQILDFFISAIEEVDWNEISKAIGEFLDSIDWTSVKEKLRTLWNDIWKVLGEVFPDSKGTFDSIRSIFDGVFIVLSKVKDAIAQIDWSPILEALGTALESVAKMDWAKVGDDISNVIRNLGDNIPELVDGISDIVDGIKELKEDITEFVSSEEFINTVGTIANELERTAEAIQTIINISANWNPIGSLGELFGIGNKDSGGGILTFLQTLASISFSGITQEFDPVISGITALRNLFSNFDKIQEDFEGFVSFISEHLGKLTENLDLGATSALGSFDSLTGGLEDLISDFSDGQISLDEIFGLIVGTFADWDTIRENFINIVNEMDERIDEFVESFTGIPDALSNLPDRFRGIFNNVIDVINGFFSSIVDGRNELVNVLGSMGGLSGAAAAFASSGAISYNNIPHLAQGAVIPPNNQFLAVLGDQKSGTNIEAPLDTIRQAVGDELAPYLEELISVNRQVIQAINNKPVISKNDIGKANAQYVAQQKIIRGTML